MGLYIFIGVVLLIPALISVKLSDIELSPLRIIVMLLLVAGAVFSLAGENMFFTSVYCFVFYIAVMYGNTRQIVQGAWDKHEVDDKIDNWAEKLEKKNKRLQRENEKKERAL